MKNHFIYLIGIIILIITVWLTTMAGINANKQKENVDASYILIANFKFDLFYKNIEKSQKTADLLIFSCFYCQ